jgi:hypothetical protein
LEVEIRSEMLDATEVDKGEKVPLISAANVCQPVT